MNKQIYCRFVKMDAATRIVKGFASQEVVDKSREIMDYEGSKPYFKGWSESFVEATGGLSKGNVRVMHSTKVAGKLNVMEPDDVQKGFYIEAEIIDDAEWALCEKGAYTGFSIGGSYVKKWDDPVHKGCTRFIAQPAEVSIVDNPCCGGSVFKYRTTEGVEELRKFEATIDPLEYFSKDFERQRGSKSELVDALVKRSKGVDVLAKNFVLAKSMYDVGELACAIAALNSTRLWLKAQAEWQDSDSTVPAQLAGPIKQLGEILAELVSDETSALTADLDAVFIASTQTSGLEKKAMNEEIVKGLIAKALTEGGYVAKAAHDDALAKVAAAETRAVAAETALNELTKAEDATTKRGGRVVELEKAVKAQTAILEQIAKRLVPAAVAKTAVSKGNDVGGNSEVPAGPDLTKVNKSAENDPTRLEVAKSIFASGGRIGGGGTGEEAAAAS